jgi:hypothetical protein
VPRDNVTVTRHIDTSALSGQKSGRASGSISNTCCAGLGRWGEQAGRLKSSQQHNSGTAAGPPIV